ncbi:MAG TPA: DUF2946 family protein [Stellaceae bacterium]|nr:DUF2946 family protein [Stellaceae bacterium]
MTRAALRPRAPAGRLGAFLGILALLLQLGVPLAHEPLAQGFASPLCHVGGIGADRHVPAPASSDHGALCPICLGLAAAASALVPPDPASGLILAALPSAPLTAWPASAEAAPTPHRAAQPRAPPAVV